MPDSSGENLEVQSGLIIKSIQRIRDRKFAARRKNLRVHRSMVLLTICLTTAVARAIVLCDV